MSDRVWLHHPASGGVFHCPAEAVDGWKERGWVEGDRPPPPPDPALKDILRVAGEAQQKTTKPSKAKEQQQ